MDRSQRPQTGITRGEDGRYKSFCRICPKSQWRRLRPEQRAGTWFASVEDALAQGKRHRQSDVHQEVVIRMASNEPTQEDIVIARIFDMEDRLAGPCSRCGYHHDHRLDCVRAARIRDREQV